MGMTIENAIKHGQEQLKVFGGEHREFIEMAVQALQQVSQLEHRCYVLTKGYLCRFCLYECEYKDGGAQTDGTNCN